MNIGDLVKFTVCYPTKASQRIEYGELNQQTKSYNQSGLRSVKTRHKGQGYFIGYRWANMENTVFHHCSYYEESSVINESYITGKREKCLLVVFTVWSKPVLVRQCNIIL